MKVSFWQCSGLIASLCVVHVQDSTASCRTKAEHLRQKCIAHRRGSVDECKTQQRAYYQMMLSRYNQEIKTAREAAGECLNRATREWLENMAEIMEQRHPEIQDVATAEYLVKEYINAHKEEGQAYIKIACAAQNAQFDDIDGQKPQSTESDCEKDYYGACDAEFNDVLSECGKN